MLQKGTNDIFNIVKGDYSNHLKDNSFFDKVIHNEEAIWEVEKIIVGGNKYTSAGYNSSCLCRLDNNGYFDTSFDIGTGFNDTVRSITQQSDGKIIIGGSFTSFNGTSINRIARLNLDGSLDTSFNVGTGFNGSVRSIVQQTNGKIIIGGEFTSFNGTSINRIVRLNLDGSLDTGFNVTSAFNNTVMKIINLSNGKMMVAGNFTSYNDTSINRLARLNSDGSLDGDYNIGTGFNDMVWSIVSLSNGKMMVAGNFTSYNGTSINRLVRLNSNGSLDTGFNIGTGFNWIVYSIDKLSDDKIIAVGPFQTYNGASVYRAIIINNDGTLNVAIDLLSSLQISSFDLNYVKVNDDKIISTGMGNNSESIFVVLNLDGTINSDFLNLRKSYRYGVDYDAQVIDIQNDGKILIGGRFDRFQIADTVLILKDFKHANNKKISIDGSVYDIFQLSNGKIIISGSFYVINQYGRLSFNQNLTSVVLNSDLSFNSMIFNPGEWIFSSPQTCAEKNDGKILIGGYGLQQFNPEAQYSWDVFSMIALNSDFTLNKTFNISGNYPYVNAIRVQPDGKVIIAGSNITQYEGINVNNIFRLNTDDTIDTSFNPGTATNGTGSRCMILQSNGKIIIGGWFTSYNGTSINRIARLNTDGTLDTSFNVGTGFNSDVNSIVKQVDDKIIVAGEFTSYNGTSINRIARLNIDGTLDTSFNVGSGLNSGVGELDIQDDGKILVAGWFSTYNGTPASLLIYLNPDGSLYKKINSKLNFATWDWIYRAKILKNT